MLVGKHHKLIGRLWLLNGFLWAAVFLTMPAAHAQRAPKQDQLPTGKQYLVGQLAAAEAKVSDMLDEIEILKKERDMLQKMLTNREKPKE